jgi:hypothetical protein
MTTTTTKNVLIMGRSQLVLNTSVELLAELGYGAQATREFDDITSQVDARQLDIVIFGGQVAPDQKSEIREALVAVNADIKFLQGLAGIPGLIVDQVDAAAAGEVLIPGQAPSYDVGKRVIGLSLFAPLEVKVTAYWATALVPPDPKSDFALLHEGQLPAGEHRFPIPDAVALNAAFATVRAGGASWSFRLSPAGS